MFCSDARGPIPVSASTDTNINSITVEVVCEIEKELQDSPYDMTSLVFLLYDIPDTALQRLLVYQRVSKDVYSTNLNLLHDWMQVAKSKPGWRHEFLEALLICQLYGIVRKLGFNIQNMKKQYQPDNIFYSMYINPTKKALYKLCENIETENLNTLKKTLETYRIDTTEYDSCELVFLKLMSEKIITSELQFDRILGSDLNFDKLIKLIQKLPGLESIANQLGMIQKRNRGEPIGQPVAASSPSSNPISDISMAMPQQSNKPNCEDEDFTSVFEMLSNLHIDETHIKSDSKNLAKDTYPIKDTKKIGVCLIINQEDFYLCDQSIEDQNLRASLSKRKGSTFDKIHLEKTMSANNFEVTARDNLDHLEMMNFIKKSIKEKVRNTTSIFMLCIMSHGVRDHVFAADCVKVKVEDIQNLLDSDDALCLRGIPKVLIIQACQVDDVSQPTLVADSPTSNQFYLCKKDFLVYWATSPEYEAFRLEEAGSIFIQILCFAIQNMAKSEHLNDIFTKVNNGVISYCTKFKRFQVPLFKSTLRKKLFLHIPQ